MSDDAEFCATKGETIGCCWRLSTAGGKLQGTCVAPSVAGNNCSKTGQDYLNEFERTGAEQAFEHIVRLYAGMVYSVCLQVTKNNHDAEDSTQAV
jgi:hypothetical protein